MIYPDAISALERSSDYAPRRLKRSDVANIRALYQEAFSGTPTVDPKTHKGVWLGRTTIWLSRDKGRIAAAKLGRATPGVTVTAHWGKRHVVGLDVVIDANCAIGSNSASWKIKVAEHRFRISTGQTQFCREVASAVRQGLGWCRWKKERLD